MRSPALPGGGKASGKAFLPKGRAAPTNGGMVSHTAEVRVRYAETDQMRVVYHANYLVWFEVARVRLLEAHGSSYPELEARGFRLPVLEAAVKYHAPARFDDALAVTATITEMKGARIAIGYEVRRGETLLCTGQTRHAFVGLDGVPRRPPEGFAERFG